MYKFIIIIILLLFNILIIYLFSYIIMLLSNYLIDSFWINFEFKINQIFIVLLIIFIFKLLFFNKQKLITFKNKYNS